MDILKGQLDIFSLNLEYKEEIQINFTTEQTKTIEELKKKVDFIEISLYASYLVIFIAKEETDILIEPQGSKGDSYKIKGEYRSYFIRKDGSIDSYSLGKVKWDNPIKMIIK